MRIQPFSDIHNYDISFQPPKTDADVIVCAGDFDMGTNAQKWNEKVTSFHEKPMIKILGNHDYWNTSATMDKTMSGWEAYYKSIETNQLSYLINETKIIDDVAFIGSTLWSDFKDRDSIVIMDSKISKDYSKIYPQAGDTITDFEIYQRYEEARSFIKQELEKHADKKCVVVTHFPPSIACNRTYRLTPSSYYWCGFMEDIISIYQPALWISGHIHNYFDEMFGDTRVIINPAGKIKNNIASNPDFKPDLVVEI